MAKKDERFYVKASFCDPQTGPGSTGTVAFGWEEAQQKGHELRQWVVDHVGVQCHIEINLDQPNQGRKDFHGL